jgi:hypothetical protein
MKIKLNQMLNSFGVLPAQIPYEKIKKRSREYVIDKYPKRDIYAGSAKYAVSEKYGGFLSKFRTLKEAKSYIRKLKRVI